MANKKNKSWADLGGGLHAYHCRPEEGLPHIRIAVAETGAEWKVYRRHQISRLAGSKAYYEVFDLRGWAVGRADSWADLLSSLSDANDAMSLLWQTEPELPISGKELS